MNTKKDKSKSPFRRAIAMIIVLGGGVALALVLQGIFSLFIQNPEVAKKPSSNSKIIGEGSSSGFNSVSIEARAAYVYDIKNKKVLFARNADEALPLASITKLMTALVAMNLIDKNAILTLTKEDLSAEGDMGFRPGEHFKLGDLLKIMLLASSNDAARAVGRFVGEKLDHPSMTADKKFITLMNNEAIHLGHEKMVFYNESGLDSKDDLRGLPAITGGYGSASEVAHLMVKLWESYPEIIEITTQKTTQIISKDSILHVFPNTNPILGKIPGLIASKTGFTDLAGGNLAIIFDRGVGDPVAIVVLGSTYEGRFKDVAKLVLLAR